MNVHVDFTGHATARAKQAPPAAKKKWGVFERLIRQHQRTRKAVREALWDACDHVEASNFPQIHPWETHVHAVSTHEELDAACEQYIEQSRVRGTWSECHEGAVHDGHSTTPPPFTEASLKKFRETVVEYHEELSKRISAHIESNIANGHYDAADNLSKAMRRDFECWNALWEYVATAASVTEIGDFVNYLAAATTTDKSFHFDRERVRDVKPRLKPGLNLELISKELANRQTGGLNAVRAATKRMSSRRTNH